MKSLRCMVGIHTGMFNSHYTYIEHKDSNEYDSIIATYAKTCSRCLKVVGYQDFAWMYGRYSYTKKEAIEKAKKFVWNGV